MLNEQGKETGKEKGLGWIPEYPDLRDYDIGNEEILRFKTEDKTASFEKIAEDLIQLIESLNAEDKGFGYRGDNERREDQIEEFKQKFLSPVQFIKVKVHHIFRYPSLQEEKPINKLPDKPDQKSLSKQQILELKKYLSLLVMANEKLKKYYQDLYDLYQKKYKDIKDTEDDLINFNEVKEIVNWMKEEDYDPTTIIIVKLLQDIFEIRNDGFFGLETYTSLNQHFSRGNKLPSIEINNYDVPCHQKSLSKIRFVPIASWIPITTLDKILEILIKKGIESRFYPEKSDSIIFEYDFLENHIGVAKDDKTIFKMYLEQDLNNIRGLIVKDNNKKELEDIVSLIDQYYIDKSEGKKSEVNEDKKEDRNPALTGKSDDHKDKEINQKKGDENENKNNASVFLSYIKNKKNEEKDLRDKEIREALRHSYLIEPIFSTILNILFPLAQFKNKSLEELIEQGLEKFESLLCSDPPKDDKDLQDDRVQRPLAEAAIEKVLFLLKMEINSLLEQHKQDDPRRDKCKYKSHIFLCFLTIKYLKFLTQKSPNTFPEQIKKAEKRIKNRQPNVFDKPEVFEIDYGEDSGLFTSLEISIPVVGYDMIRQLKSHLGDENKKRYSLLPSIVDLSFWCSPVRDQGSLNSCTAFAAISLFEYFVNRAFNQKADASPLFLYKATRNKMNITEDVGASIRETMKALALYGVPPESSWSYHKEKVDEEPPAYCYSYAQNYQSLKYFLLDYAGISKETLLFQIKAVLAAGFPCIFGFTIYNSAYDDSNKPGHIPFPAPENDQVVGGHTVVTVGYDDFKLIQCADRKKDSKGAFLIRNSWGENWGVQGYGWLPYDYVLAGLTAAWWSLLKSEWFKEGSFGAAGEGGGGPGGQP